MKFVVIIIFTFIHLLISNLFRSLLESVTEERDKLRNDLTDANNRAAVLAQEVDEHHARIEKATRNKVK
jgi:ninein